jgi:hypothetical protein
MEDGEIPEHNDTCGYGQPAVCAADKGPVCNSPILLHSNMLTRPETPLAEGLPSNSTTDKGTIDASGKNIPSHYLITTGDLPVLRSSQPQMSREYGRVQCLLLGVTASMNQSQVLENVKMAYWWAGYYSGLYEAQQAATQQSKE